eukprot:GHVU01171040.1.p1 GENE.GHVU01171040.1~~GHVU01171040.1.p1  ORF type:complete len:223 (-),score=18.10 GHVU01171040.1:7-675(-)
MYLVVGGGRGAAVRKYSSNSATHESPHARTPNAISSSAGERMGRRKRSEGSWAVRAGQATRENTSTSGKFSSFGSVTSPHTREWLRTPKLSQWVHTRAKPHTQRHNLSQCTRAQTHSYTLSNLAHAKAVALDRPTRGAPHSPIPQRTITCFLTYFLPFVVSQSVTRTHTRMPPLRGCSPPDKRDCSSACVRACRQRGPPRDGGVKMWDGSWKREMATGEWKE